MNKDILKTGGRAAYGSVHLAAHRLVYRAALPASRKRRPGGTVRPQLFPARAGIRQVRGFLSCSIILLLNFNPR